KAPKYFQGMGGILCNLSYSIPLFDFTTPSFFSKNVKRELNWQIFWDFFIDIGLANETESGDLSLPLLGFNLVPALAAGTVIRLRPAFVPIEIKLTIGLDAWQLIKSKSIGGSITLLLDFPDT
ncbi:MAG: hypothetical protein MJB14_04670, partial [Spirochaetes bacterium]|nr:hypothetical protein [Spirochaetota bacterium]